VVWRVTDLLHGQKLSRLAEAATLSSTSRKASQVPDEHNQVSGPMWTD
jgi:hypothetical protein